MRPGVSDYAEYKLFDHMQACLKDIQADVHKVLTIVQSMQTKENTMAVDLTALTTEVTNNTTVTASVLALVQGLVTQIQNIPPSTDPTTQAALNALVASLTANDGQIAAAVAANTPAPPTP
jgi:small-conductance mechanosensitive channel